MAELQAQGWRRQRTRTRVALAILRTLLAAVFLGEALLILDAGNAAVVMVYELVNPDALLLAALTYQLWARDSEVNAARDRPGWQPEIDAERPQQGRLRWPSCRRLRTLRHAALAVVAVLHRGV